MSFFSKIAAEASAALSDAYGHVVHGDDAGASARLVWVVHPTKVPLDIDGGGGGTGGTQPSMISEASSPAGRTGSGYLFTQRFDLGLTFLEINDRAYVRTVDPGSSAERAGVQPQDCVQFACVVGGPQFDGMQLTTSSTPSSRRSKIEQFELDKLERKASKFVLDCEGRGMRISYEELRDMFSGCTLPPKQGEDHVELTPPRGEAESAKQRRENGDDFTVGSNSLMLVDSMGGMFEKKQKKNVSSRRVPSFPVEKKVKSVTRNVTNAARTAAGRCFEGGNDDGSTLDESTTRRRQDTETPASPIKSENLTSSQSGGYTGDSIVEQQLYPVVLVFRRTVQRKTILSPSKGWRSPGGLALRGSMFGIPNFRMDDECDRAAALIRHLSNTSRRTSRQNDAIFTGDDDTIATELSTVAGNIERPLQDENIEASTIRGMIQNAVGLGFVRLSKVVVGVSLQGGSGILISRLSDGTWSAPSAMGVYGLGLGLQFGLEVADFLFIIQTKEGMAHFKRGGNFALGGNIGAAVANCGREAYGAASLGACTGRGLNLDDAIVQQDIDENASRYDDNRSASSTRDKLQSQKNNSKDGDVAPVTAYAKSQGLYFGVSVDGLKFFTRNDINSRTYKFAMLSELPAKDILSGHVSPPPCAEDLYLALHSVEYTHEVQELPRAPEMLRKDSMNDWRYDRSVAACNGEIVETLSSGGRRSPEKLPAFAFLSTLNREEADRFALFETKFKKFLYGGVTVQRLIPNVSTRNGLTRREKRTMWLMLPEVGSLRIGFVSKANDGDNDSVLDDMSSIAPSMVDGDESLPDNRTISLSQKHSISLTDIISLSHEPDVTIRLSPDDATEHLRVLSIQDVMGNSMLFLANSSKEAEMLFCGLKLLLECETSRLSVRGGVSLDELGGQIGKGALTPKTARGSARRRSRSRDRNDLVSKSRNSRLDDKSRYSSFGDPGTDSDESSGGAKAKALQREAEGIAANVDDRHRVPDGRASWSQLPGRNHMKFLAAAPTDFPPPTYELGKVISTAMTTNVTLPLPLSMCRTMFLDSSSPLNRSWEAGRTDINFQHGQWTFPPGSVREFEQTSSSEHQLIARASMVGAQRSISYSRTRNRELVRLTETVVVERDDEKSLVFVVADQMPRRGFAARARIRLHSFSQQSCEARVLAEIRPVGKNLTDQNAVHKAFLLVLEELNKRYGVDEKGLLSVFLDVYHTIPTSNTRANNVQKPTMTSFRDTLGGSVHSSPAKSDTRPSSFKTSVTKSTAFNTKSPSRNRSSHLQYSHQNEQPVSRNPANTSERPSTPSVRIIDSRLLSSMPSNGPAQPSDNEFADFSSFDGMPRNPVTVEVKPPPKIRLDLCPVPREEDEDEKSEGSGIDVKHSKHRRRSKHSKTKRNHRSRSKSRG